MTKQNTQVRARASIRARCRRSSRRTALSDAANRVVLGHAGAVDEADASNGVGLRAGLRVRKPGLHSRKAWGWG